MCGWLPVGSSGICASSERGEHARRCKRSIVRSRCAHLRNEGNMESYETFEYDVLVVGAGGAGLRAVIAAREAGCTVGVICKSLLGKAHTVMAEGGVAAALGNMVTVDGQKEPDDWKVHFVDTMKGGAFLNNWRMAEIFAKEA